MTDIDYAKMAAQTPEFEGFPGSLDGPPETPEERERALKEGVKEFEEADRPDIPVIEKPRPGQVHLLHGAVIGDERYRTATVRELNGSDEEALARIDKRAWNYNTMVQDTLVKRCTTLIGDTRIDDAEGRKVLNELILGDRDRLFAEVLLCTYGRTLDIENVTCPHCDQLQDFGVDFDELLIFGELEEGLDPDGFEVVVDANDVKSTYLLRYPRGKDQLAVWSGEMTKTDAQIDTEILQRCVLKKNGAAIDDPRSWALGASKVVRHKLIAALAKQPLVRFKEVEVPCLGCAVGIQTAIGWADLL